MPIDNGDVTQDTGTAGALENPESPCEIPEDRPRALAGKAANAFVGLENRAGNYGRAKSAAQ